MPVVDLRDGVELPAARSRAETRILVLRRDAGWVGAIVDYGARSRRPFGAQLRSRHPGLFRGLAAEFMSGIGVRGMMAVVLPSIAC